MSTIENNFQCYKKELKICSQISINGRKRLRTIKEQIFVYLWILLIIMKRILQLFLVVVFGSINIVFAQKKEVKSSKYDIQGPFCNGLAKVCTNHKWGYIKKDGGVVVKPKYLQAENFDEGLARVRTIKGWGLIDTTGNVVLVTEFNYISDFVDGKAKVRMISGEETYINRKGQNIGR